MSEHLEMSGQSSLDKNFQIRTNNEGENELYIPCWEEEGSNSTQYHHLIEETKFFKNKCKHLENHLEENHREFSSLNQLYMIAQANERRLLKENEELRKAGREGAGEMAQLRMERDSAAAELHACGKREAELRERFFKSKEREAELVGEVEGLRAECDMLKRRTSQGRDGEEQKWKKYYNQQIGKIQEQWKAAYEELELEFDKKSKEVRERTEELKLANKNCNAHRQDYEARIRALEGELEEMRRQAAKNRAAMGDYERQIKDLKLVRDEVSLKNDEIEGENSRLKKTIKDEGVKYGKLDARNKELQANHQELHSQFTSASSECSSLKSVVHQLRARVATLENELNQAKSERDRLAISKGYLQNSNSSLQQELASVKRDRESEKQSLKSHYENRLRELKESTSLQRAGLEDTISSLKIEIEVLKSQKRQNSKQEASANERISHLQEDNSTLKIQIASWRDRYQKLSAKYKEDIPSSRDCNHLGEISDLRQQIRKLTEQKEQYRVNLATNSRIVEDLNAKMEEDSHRIDLLTQEIERLGKEKKRLAEEKERLSGDKNRLAGLVESLERERDTLQNEKRDFLSQERTKNQQQVESSQKIKNLQAKLKEKTTQIERLTASLQTVEEQLESFKQKSREETREPQKDRNKRYEAKLKEKERQIKELQQRLQEIENEHEQERTKFKAIQKENRSKESELTKRERKIKELEKTSSELLGQIEEMEEKSENDKTELDALRRQLKAEQSANEKLKAQISRNNSEKENWVSQQASNRNRIDEKERHQWQQSRQKYIAQLRLKQQEIKQLKDRVSALQSTPPPKVDQGVSAETEQYLRAKIKQLQDQLKQKQESIRRLQAPQRRDDDSPPSGTLQQLQAEYSRQLQALKRLILYKGYKQDESKRLEETKAEYQSRIAFLLSDYKSMYQQMMLLKQKVLSTRVTVVSEPVDVSSIEQVWRMKVQQIAEEREVLIEKVAMWQRKYDEMHYLFSAKIESKEETINLLNLKLNNLEMSKGCNYSCHR